MNFDSLTADAHEFSVHTSDTLARVRPQYVAGLIRIGVFHYTLTLPDQDRHIGILISFPVSVWYDTLSQNLQYRNETTRSFFEIENQILVESILFETVSKATKNPLRLTWRDFSTLIPVYLTQNFLDRLPEPDEILTNQP